MFVFELGGWNVDEQTKKRFEGLVNALPPRKSKQIVRFKRLGNTGAEVRLSLDDEEKSAALVKKEMERILSKEKEWIESSEKYIAALQVSEQSQGE